MRLLLSKADLRSPEDRAKALAYTKQEVLANLNLRVAVHPVSSAAFDSRADAYRAQVGRLMTGKAISAEERARIETDIASLENFMAAESED